MSCCWIAFCSTSDQKRKKYVSSCAALLLVWWMSRGREAVRTRPIPHPSQQIQELFPHNDNQRFLQSQALSMAIQLGQTRSLMFAQETSSVPMLLLAVLV